MGLAPQTRQGRSSRRGLVASSTPSKTSSFTSASSGTYANPTGGTTSPTGRRARCRSRERGVDRARRYDKWYPLLLEEVDLVATSDAPVFAVGKDVAWHLRRLGFPRHVTRVIHYSPLGSAARASGIIGHEDDFEEFRASVSLDLVLATAREVLNESVPPSVRDETLAQLSRKQMTVSRQRLIFNYKLAFEATRGGSMGPDPAATGSEH